MHKKTVDIKYASLFPWPFRFIALLILISGATLITEKTILAIILMIVAVLVLSGYEGTEIDVAAKTYREYTSFFFMKTGSMLNYSGIEKIFINTTKTKERFYTAHTTKSSIYENVEFNGILKFEDGTKVHLLQKRKKAELMKALSKISAELKIPVEDNTEIGRL